jgi:hypothetical protein
MNKIRRDDGGVFLTSRARAAWNQGLESRTRSNPPPKSLYQMQRLHEEQFCGRTKEESANLKNTPAVTRIPAESAIY